MNKIQVLMEKRNEGQMNVPLEKLDEYLANGWFEKSRGPMGGFDPDAKPVEAAEQGAGSEAPVVETAKQRKSREKAEREAAEQGAGSETSLEEEPE